MNMKVKNLVMGIAILILTISVAVYGISLVFDEPEYGDYCPDSYRGVPVKESGDEICPAVCIAMWEISEGECIFNECCSGCGPDGIISFESLEQCEIVLGGKDCYDLYENAREKYSRNLFLITLPFGIVIIAVGALVFGLETVGAGLMAGGVGVILWGVAGFGDLQKIG